MNQVIKHLMYLIVRLFHATYRYQYVGQENLKKAKEMSPSNSYIFGVWHQNLFAGILAQAGTEHVVIASRSKDSEGVSYTMEKLGIKVFRGSSKRNGVDKGGKEAKDQMIEVLKTGVPGALTIDGPKGPVHVVKPGIIDMAKKSQATIIPYIPMPKNYWAFNSWDKFRLPKPFTKILVYYGEPFSVSADADEEKFEEYRERLKNDLIGQEPKVLALLGQKPSEQKEFSPELS